MPILNPDKLLIIAGPCALESAEICQTVAQELTQIAEAFPELQIIFKGSFDKANRTSIHSNRGPGLDKGLEYLESIKSEFGFKVLTDIHEVSQIAPVARVVDILQIPAFLCRQTDLLVAAAKSGCVVNVKKGQFLSPGDMQHVVRKLEEAEAGEIWLTERGSTFGYQNLVVDMRSVDILKGLGHPMIFDATHSVQMPGGGNGTTSGKREFVPCLTRAAVAAGADGLFIETHPDPDNAISDGPNQIPLDQLKPILEQALLMHQAYKSLPPVDLS